MNKSQIRLYSFSSISNQGKMSETTMGLETSAMRKSEKKEIYHKILLKNKDCASLTRRQNNESVSELTKSKVSQRAINEEPCYFTHI